ncbi:unnamed protein product [Linum trigynum]|uniref:RNase H type-1 domain-containing protein n=1 Tax=Linum trigynum TaxID=586398 RepID=A0AAV2DF64_9ROSI
MGEGKNCETWLCDLIEGGSTEELLQVLMTLLFLWKERNNHLSSNPKLEEWEIVSKALNYLEEYKAQQRQGGSGTPSSRPRARSKWEPPPDGLLKLNTDAAIQGEEGAGYEMILRDNSGNFLMGATYRTRRRWPIEMAEAQAMLWGLKLTRANYSQPLLLESDCQSVIQKLNRREATEMEVGMICDEIREFANGGGNVEWRFWKREGNACAHKMARLKCRVDETEIWFSRPPVILVPLILQESNVVPEL